MNNWDFREVGSWGLCCRLELTRLTICWGRKQLYFAALLSQQPSGDQVNTSTSAGSDTLLGKSVHPTNTLNVQQRQSIVTCCYYWTGVMQGKKTEAILIWGWAEPLHWDKANSEATVSSATWQWWLALILVC